LERQGDLLALYLPSAPSCLRRLAGTILFPEAHAHATGSSAPSSQAWACSLRGRRFPSSPAIFVELMLPCLRRAVFPGPAGSRWRSAKRCNLPVSPTTAAGGERLRRRRKRPSGAWGRGNPAWGGAPEAAVEGALVNGSLYFRSLIPKMQGMLIQPSEQVRGQRAWVSSCDAENPPWPLARVGFLEWARLMPKDPRPNPPPWGRRKTRVLA